MLFDDSESNVKEALEEGVNAFPVDRKTGLCAIDWLNAVNYLLAVQSTADAPATAIQPASLLVRRVD